MIDSDSNPESISGNNLPMDYYTCSGVGTGGGGPLAPPIIRLNVIVYFIP